MLDSQATGMILLTSLFCFLKWQEFFFREFREKINIFFFLKLQLSQPFMP